MALYKSFAEKNNQYMYGCCFQYVKTDIMEICVTLIVVAVKMDTHAINTTDLVIMAVCLTFSNPTVKVFFTIILSLKKKIFDLVYYFIDAFSKLTLLLFINRSV